MTFRKDVIAIIWVVCCALSAALCLAGSNPEGTMEKAGDSQVLDLSRAVELALENHPKIRAAAAGERAAAAGLRQAQAGYLPSVRLSERVVRSNNPVFAFGSLLEQGRFGPSNFDPKYLNDPDPLTNFRTEVGAFWTLFDQLQTPTRVTEAKIAVEKADLENRWAGQHVRFMVIRSFFGVIVADARVKVAEQAVKSASAQVKQIQDFYEQGQVVRSDLLAAKVQLAEFRQQLIQARGELETARTALRTALGDPPLSGLRPVGSLEIRTLPDFTLDELIRQAHLHRPDLQMARKEVMSSKARLRRALAQYFPRVDAFSVYGGSGKDLSSGNSDYALGLSLTWDLFRGDRRPGIDQARAQVELAEAALKEMTDRIRYQVVRAYEAYRSASERVGVAEKAVGQAKEVLRIVRDRYKEGLTTITEVLRAETAYLQARLWVLAARYQQITGCADVLLQTGRLEDVGIFQTASK